VPVRAEYSIDLKNLADLYVWFYRWAIWKLFETESAPRRGVLSFISNSKWIVGGAFGGVRQVFRQYFDQIYIIDLHGDHRAPLPAGIYDSRFAHCFDGFQHLSNI
jgi:predicted helicase